MPSFRLYGRKEIGVFQAFEPFGELVEGTSLTHSFAMYLYSVLLRLDYNSIMDVHQLSASSIFYANFFVFSPEKSVEDFLIQKKGAKDLFPCQVSAYDKHA